MSALGTFWWSAHEIFSISAGDRDQDSLLILCFCVLCNKPKKYTRSSLQLIMCGYLNLTLSISAVWFSHDIAEAIAIASLQLNVAAVVRAWPPPPNPHWALPQTLASGEMRTPSPLVNRISSAVWFTHDIAEAIDMESLQRRVDTVVDKESENET